MKYTYVTYVEFCFKIALRIPLGRDLSPPPPRPLRVRSSPSTCQIRDATVPAGFTTHILQVMHRKRADPMCPSVSDPAGCRSDITMRATDDRAQA